MSVVPEVISARHCELRVVAVSAITNMAEGLSDVKLSHAQTHGNNGDSQSKTLLILFAAFCAKLPE